MLHKRKVTSKRKARYNAWSSLTALKMSLHHKVFSNECLGPSVMFKGDVLCPFQYGIFTRAMKESGIELSELEEVKPDYEPGIDYDDEYEVRALRVPIQLHVQHRPCLLLVTTFHPESCRKCLHECFFVVVILQYGDLKRRQQLVRSTKSKLRKLDHLRRKKKVDVDTFLEETDSFFDQEIKMPTFNESKWAKAK